MPYALTLADDVRWRGEPVAGDRPRALIRALADAGATGSSADALIDAVWGDEPPANPTKALQVQVSRVRSATEARLIERTPRGYRLGLSRDEVDVFAQADLRAAARAAYDANQLDKALDCARRALDIAPDDGLRAIVATAIARSGEHAAALPLLEELAGDRPGDEHVLACLLRSEAAVRGPAPALERYERYRKDVADRVGADPGPEVQDAYRELLAADRPVREGLRYDSASLLGRDEDLRALRAALGSSRVVSIVGAGGLGKTRLAHVLGRHAVQPVVHFVELVGVGDPDDVVGEVGSVLGVRDSLVARQSLTPEQRADVRTRIAQQLAAAPSLLILDNCEHVVDAVADLVAFLVATTRDLRVVTTSRASLNIAAERVYALGQLHTDDAVELFRQRATAARRNIALDESIIADIVERLDGLPLAIELAAAKARVMSVEDIARRLENRFALLRGGDRTAPDRHQTLVAVIDWSWNLLDEQRRRALRRLSVFHDGFTIEAAEAMLGDSALDDVDTLAQQSLLSVRDAGHSVRYQMLETVREFGRMQLVDAGEDTETARDQRAWAVAYAADQLRDLFGPRQVEAMDALRAEESNLADVLRHAFAEPDPEAVVVVFGGLAVFWSISGEHGRIIGRVKAFEDTIDGWKPSPEYVDHARVAATVAVTNAMMAFPGLSVGVYDFLAELGPDAKDPVLAAMCQVVLAFDPARPNDLPVRVAELCESPDPYVARQALQFSGHLKENVGDADAAVADAMRAIELGRDDEGPWLTAIQRAQLAQLLSQLGRFDAAAEHARLAIPVLDRLHADDDSIQCQSVLASQAMAEGDLDEAERIFAEIEAREHRGSGFAGGTALLTGRAELLLLRGQVDAGFARLRSGIERAREIRFPEMEEPSGLEPWSLATEAITLAAYALYEGGDDGWDLWHLVTVKVRKLATQPGARLDYPVLGLVLFALGVWALERDALDTRDAVRLCVFAERFGYPRRTPTMAWQNAVDAAERRGPGVLDELLAEYGDARGPDLLGDARKLLDRLFPKR